MECKTPKLKNFGFRRVFEGCRNLVQKVIGSLIGFMIRENGSFSDQLGAGWGLARVG